MPKSRTLYRVKRREWLNPDSTALSAFVIAKVGDTSRARSRTTTPDIMFKMADCNDMIELEFGMWSDKQRDRSLQKARLLRDVVNEFVDAVETEYELVKRRRSRVPAKKVKQVKTAKS